MRKELKAAKELNKGILGDKSLDFIEIDKKRLTDEEIVNRASDVEIFYKNHFKDIIALKELEWLRSLGKHAETAEQVIWHRGALHCLKEIKDWFEEQTKISLARFDEEKESEDGVPII